MSNHELEYKNHVIIATPALQNSLWTTSGHIQKTDGPLAPRVFFLTSDTFLTEEEAIKNAWKEGKKIIDGELQGKE
ncbi:MAG TPA: HlyU family transcriptional regulator [Thermodesulfobacteriota bacterium]|nr:HlyU family transcriptional regulator [Thermodesulfobacteriota bacterium]HNU71642.1 HlyU family transcriptional regulator [Thermodesulfobacteriota bacterium]HOC37650.1 HlyU family transcriptional regulator [Thermodesulfobacteriota bacterium]